MIENKGYRCNEDLMHLIERELTKTVMIIKIGSFMAHVFLYLVLLRNLPYA